MNPIYDQGDISLYQGDCLEVLAEMPDDSVDTIITDPPAGINFMGKEWDRDKGGARQWIDWLTQVMEQCLRVAKPGAFALVWALPRTSHWTGTAIELAGWEIRDCIQHIFAQGFKKGLDIGKAIDEKMRIERMVIGKKRGYKAHYGDNKAPSLEFSITAPATPQATQWDGWHTSLKPSAEFWWLAMKPLDGTFANNAMEHGVAGLAIDKCRIEGAKGSGVWGSNQEGSKSIMLAQPGRDGFRTEPHPKGRWPSHLFLSHHDGCVRRGVRKVKGEGGRHINAKDGDASWFVDGIGARTKYHDEDGYETIDDWQCHPDCPVRILGEKSGERRGGICSNGAQEGLTGTTGIYGKFRDRNVGGYLDEGTASRFFRQLPFDRFYYYPKEHRTRRGPTNSHPTVKSLALMEEFCKLTSTPTGGIVLDPFAGSGTTLLAARNTGREAIGIEIDPSYCQIIIDRLAVTPEEQMQVKQKASKGYADLPLFGSNGA